MKNVLEVVKFSNGNNGLLIIPKIAEAHKDVETGKFYDDAKRIRIIGGGF